jgi:glutathione S-transferase
MSSSIVEIDTSIDPSYDLTTIKVNLKYPKNNYVLNVLDLCPYSLKTKLAFEYKLLVCPDIEYWVSNWSPQAISNFCKLESRPGFNEFPQLKIQHQQSLEQVWVSDSTEILKTLDAAFTENSLFHENNPALNSEISLLEDWIDESFKIPFLCLKFFNKFNLDKAIMKWTAREDGLIDNLKLKLYIQEKINYLLSNFPSKDIACSFAKKRFEEDLLPLVSDRLDRSNAQGANFLTGNLLSAADLGLYSFLKLLLNFEEAGLVNRRPTLLKFIAAIEDISLGEIDGNSRVGSTRHKMVIVGRETPGHIKSAVNSLR